MPDPIFSLYEDDSTVTGGTPISSGNPIDFGRVEKGVISPTITVHIWNGKNDPTVPTAIGPRLYAVNATGDASLIFNGTPFNGHRSMLEARSCGSFHTPADQDTNWTPLSPLSLLAVGDMPSNSMREIELRMNVPLDAPTIPLIPFSVGVSA
jgi:hypothetical protein